MLLLSVFAGDTHLLHFPICLENRRWWEIEHFSDIKGTERRRFIFFRLGQLCKRALFLNLEKLPFTSLCGPGTGSFGTVQNNLKSNTKKKVFGLFIHFTNVLLHTYFDYLWSLILYAKL